MDCFFDDPLVDAAERYRAGSEWNEVKNYLPAIPGRVLDVGAGRGISSYAFAKEGWTVFALEPDTSTIVGSGAIRILAKEANVAIDVNESFGEKLPYGNDFFDVVYTRQVLHHAVDLSELCREIARVLRPGGCLIATREHVIDKYEDLGQFLNDHPLYNLYGGERAYLLREYRDAIEKSGIRITHIPNSCSSDINLFPDSKVKLKQRIAEKLKVVPAYLIPDALLRLKGSFDSTPGRLFTFIGRKPLWRKKLY